MKTTIKLFLFVLSISIFSSCSDSSNSVDVTADDLVGVWNLTDINGEGTSTTTINGQSITADVTTTGRDYDFTTEITTNPNTISGTGSYVAISTSTFLGQTVTEEQLLTSISGLDSGTWSLDGNIITTIVGGETNQIVVEQVTDNLLVLGATFEETQQIQGISVNFSGTVRITLEK